jgi:diguanylate cyclase (GGDEF)-like protein
MSFSDKRAQFSIFLFFADADESKEMKGAFVEAGYESFVFADQDTLIERIREAAPHVIVFSPEALQFSLSEFVEKVLEVNSEIQFAIVASSSQADSLSEYREYNFVALIPAGEKLPLRTVWAVDQVCENLYRIYQNETLLNQYDDLKQDFKKIKEEISDIERQKQQLERQTAQVKEVSLAEKMRVYQGAQSKDDYLAVFLQHLPCHAIYFKFLPTVNSFVATASQKLEIESIKGVGSRLTGDEVKSLVEDLEAGRLPASLTELMSEGLKVPRYYSQPVPVHRGLDGLLVFWGDADFHYRDIENDFLIFHMLYQQAHLIKRNEGFDIYDPVTELYNRNFFLKKMDEEIARARRLEKAVSVVRLSVDHLTEMDQSFGRNNRDLILRTIGSIIKKTSRVNDFSCRTEDNEFSLILPHCARKGAALRAERLRRIIEGHTFAINDLKITVSCGVSEYPTLSTGASDLEVSAGKALEFIVSRGGNKVCLFKPVQEFKPDFEVPPI